MVHRFPNIYKKIVFYESVFLKTLLKLCESALNRCKDVADYESKNCLRLNKKGTIRRLCRLKDCLKNLHAIILCTFMVLLLFKKNICYALQLNY